MLKKSVKLLDFNPFCKKTDSLLYSWDELMNMNQIEDGSDFKAKNLELRLIETDIGVQSNAYSMYSQPRDALDFNELGTNNIDILQSLIQTVFFIF